MHRTRRRTRIGIAFTLMALVMLTAGMYHSLHQNELDHQLLNAIRINDTAAALEAIRMGANPNERGSTLGTLSAPSLLDLLQNLLHPRLHAQHTVNANRSTVLMQAAQRGNAAVVQALLDHGADIRATRTPGLTALASAVATSHSNVVSILLQHGADPNVTGMDGMPIFMVACSNGNTRIIHELLNHGANTNVRDVHGVTPLMVASMMSERELYRTLVERSTEINSQDKNGMTALIAAVQAGNKGAVDLLLDHGANRELKTSTNESATIYAALYGEPDILADLIRRGAKVDVNWRDPGRNDLLHATMMGSYLDGGNLSRSGIHPLTPSVALAQDTRICQVVQILLDHGASINAQTPATATSERYTALLCAVMRRRPHIASYLIQKGADVNLRAGTVSALKVAERNRDVEMITLLKKAGAKE